MFDNNLELISSCRARQCLPLRRKFIVCSIIQLALSILIVKHLVIGQRQKAPNFSAFHWSTHGRMVSIGQHFYEGSTFTEKDRNKFNYRSGPNHQIGPGCAGRA